MPSLTSFAKTENSVKFSKLPKIPQLQEVLVHLIGGSHDSFLLHKFRQLCSLFSLLAICRDEEVCTDVGSEQNKLLVWAHIFGSHQFHPHPPEAEKLPALSLPPLSQYLPFFLAFLEHLSPYLPEYIYYWFQNNSSCNREKHFRPS